jgi:hypothetical protein
MLVDRKRSRKYQTPFSGHAMTCKVFIMYYNSQARKQWTVLENMGLGKFFS